MEDEEESIMPITKKRIQLVFCVWQHICVTCGADVVLGMCCHIFICLQLQWMKNQTQNPMLTTMMTMRAVTSNKME